jgi:hypothetical protein
MVDLADLAQTPTIMADTGGEGVFTIEDKGTTQLHTNFTNFINDVEQRVGNGSTVRKLVANGSFDDSTATLTTRIISIKLVSE